MCFLMFLDVRELDHTIVPAYKLVRSTIHYSVLLGLVIYLYQKEKTTF